MSWVQTPVGAPARKWAEQALCSWEYSRLCSSRVNGLGAWVSCTSVINSAWLVLCFSWLSFYSLYAWVFFTDFLQPLATLSGLWILLQSTVQFSSAVPWADSGSAVEVCYKCCWLFNSVQKPCLSPQSCGLVSVTSELLMVFQFQITVVWIWARHLFIAWLAVLCGAYPWH